MEQLIEVFANLQSACGHSHFRESFGGPTLRRTPQWRRNEAVFCNYLYEGAMHLHRLGENGYGKLRRKLWLINADCQKFATALVDVDMDCFPRFLHVPPDRVRYHIHYQRAQWIEYECSAQIMYKVWGSAVTN